MSAKTRHPTLAVAKRLEAADVGSGAAVELPASVELPAAEIILDAAVATTLAGAFVLICIVGVAVFIDVEFDASTLLSYITETKKQTATKANVVLKNIVSLLLNLSFLNL